MRLLTSSNLHYTVSGRNGDLASTTGVVDIRRQRAGQLEDVLLSLDELCIGNGTGKLASKNQ